MRLVLLLKTNIDSVSPMWTQMIDLSRHDNMIWVCPVFDNYKKAVEYAWGDKSIVIAVQNVI